MRYDNKMTDDQRRTAAWLGRVRGIDCQVNILLDEQKDAYRRAVSATQQLRGDRVQGGGGESDNKIVSYAAYSEMIDREIDKLYEVKCEVLGAIKQVESPSLRELLFYRYIKCLTWEAVAERLYYSERHVVYNLHRKALDAVAEVIGTL